MMIGGDQPSYAYQPHLAGMKRATGMNPSFVRSGSGKTCSERGQISTVLQGLQDAVGEQDLLSGNAGHNLAVGQPVPNWPIAKSKAGAPGTTAVAIYEEGPLEYEEGPLESVFPDTWQTGQADVHQYLSIGAAAKKIVR